MYWGFGSRGMFLAQLKLKNNNMEKETQLTDYEKDYLLDMIIQELEDDDECVGTLHKETLQSIYDKLIQIK